MKKILSLILLSAIAGSAAVTVFARGDWKTQFPWAVSGVEYCISNSILSGSDGDLMLDRKLTKSQTAKMIAVAFGLPDTGSNSFDDTDPAAWDYTYINAIEPYLPKKESSFEGDTAIKREEFTAIIGTVMGYSPDYDNSLHEVFSDASKIDYDYRGYVAKAVADGIITGSNGNFRPKAYLTRAEACTIIERAVGIKGAQATAAPTAVPTAVPTAAPTAVPTAAPDNTGDAQAQFDGSTNILGAAQISVEQAQAWARSKGATDKFINIAPTYWYYGSITGIRPEVLYAQAALETGYGQYNGVVSEDMNNWAGIKVYGRNDDAKDAHESFATPEEGVRAHFNHMAAYVGIEPVGEPHGRYYSVKSMSWAGTVRTLEELSGKWCPDPEYAQKILDGCLIPMSEF